MGNLVIECITVADPVDCEGVSLYDVYDREVGGERFLVETFAYLEDAQEFVDICEESESSGDPYTL